VVRQYEPGNLSPLGIALKYGAMNADGTTENDQVAPTPDLIQVPHWCYNVVPGGPMLKKLVRHGNSLALIIDKPVLDLLRITEETPLEISTFDGKSLQITPTQEAPTNRPSLKKALDRTNNKFGKTLRNLAK
jgi:antitoxin MazE